MNKIEKTEGQLLPAYPLFVKDPFFSLWSASNELNGGETIFWTGKRRRAYGAVNCDGKSYSFMGLLDKAERLTQTKVSLTAFSTDYEFTCDAFDLKVSFVSPLPPTNLTLLSCPVCYMTYTLTPKKEIGKASVSLMLHEEFCYDREQMPVHGGVHKLPQGETAWMGLKKQLPMSQSSDDSTAEWGYWYLTGDYACITSRGGVDKYLVTGEPTFEWASGDKYITAYNKHEKPEGTVEGKMTLAFDDMVSIAYFGDWRKGYYFNEGKNIFDAIEDAWSNYDSVMAELAEFDADLIKRTEKYGEDYLLVLYAGLRQAVGAHKLVKDKKGEILWLSKECHSNGCIATVDVSYPSMPLFLLYNPELVKGMMRPIFEFANMPVWEYDFAPHDVGTYPQCLGQVYSANGRHKSPERNMVDLKNYPSDGQKDISYTYPPYYMFPKGEGVYFLEKQMPVEECGNMLVMVAATLAADKDITIAKKNFKMLLKWVKYLVKYGLKPGNQLCTDDFAGHLDKNINLSVKAIVGIRAFAYICEKLNKDSLAVKYKDIAYNYATEWKKMCVVEGKNTPLVFDGDPDETFALKYNMAFDVMFGTGLFDEKTRETEIDTYIAKNNTYGVPLDSRALYTKSDWILWAATLTDSVEKRKALIAPIAKFLRESSTRYPFTDWYYTDNGKIRGTVGKWGYHNGFKNRTVQGGLFILLLADSGIIRIE